MVKGAIWIYGRHAVFSTLKCKQVNVFKVIALEKYNSEINSALSARSKARNVQAEYKATRIEVENAIFKNLVKKKSETKELAHQGIAALVEPMQSASLNEILAFKLVVVLDEITDINNIGAIIRSAFAFEVGAVIVSKKLDILKKAEVYKTSAGYIRNIKILEVPNISETLRRLKCANFWILGMQIEDSKPISKAKGFEKIALVLGSEGKGLRALTKDRCDVFVSIPINPSCESLNVSTAAAVAFYELGS